MAACSSPEITRSTGCNDGRRAGGRASGHSSGIEAPRSMNPAAWRSAYMTRAESSRDGRGTSAIGASPSPTLRPTSTASSPTSAENCQLNAPNGTSPSNAGRIYFSDLRLFGVETIDQRINAVPASDPPAAGAKGLWPISRILGDNGKMNGVELSGRMNARFTSTVRSWHQRAGRAGSGRVDRTGHGGLVAYPLDADSWRAARPGESRLRGRMTTDAEGNIYAAPSRRQPHYVFRQLAC